MQVGSKQDSTSLPVKEPREPDRSWPRGYVHVHVWECVRGSVRLLVLCTFCVCVRTFTRRARTRRIPTRTPSACTQHGGQAVRAAGSASDGQ